MSEMGGDFRIGQCPIESGVVGYLADNECRHGRLRTDRTPPCGCWPSETKPAVTVADAMELWAYVAPALLGPEQ